MSPRSQAASAYALAVGDDRAAAETVLGALPGADDTPGAMEAALTGAGWARIGRAERGLPYLRRDWTDAPPDAAGLAGAVLLTLGHVDTALPALQRAVAGQTRDPGAHLVNLGRALTLLGRAEEARAHLAAAVGLVTHDHCLALCSLAEALVVLGRIDDALALLPAETDDESLLAARSTVFCLAGRHDEAAGLLREALARLQDATVLLLLAAELAEVRGRSGEAAALLRRAIDKDPGNAALWARLAQTGRRGAAGPEARKAAAQAMALAEGADPPVRAIALSAHAHVLGEEGNTTAAEAAWRECLSLVPGTVPALSGLGHLLLQLGRVEEALDCFRQLRATAPLQGWTQLIHAREVPDDPAVLQQMERAAHQPSLEGPVRTGLLFTVAAAWERKGDHERAFTLAVQANEASKPLLPYDPAAHRARVEREMAFFSAGFMASRGGWGHPSRLPVFVLGMPRSGTTLTEQILGSHSQVHGAGELGQVGELIARLEAWEAKLGTGLRYPDCVADMTAAESRRLAGRMLEDLRSHDPQALRIVDKLPHNFEHVGLIRLLFPNAAIIHCRREPRDIALSNYFTDYGAKFGGMGFAYDLGWIGEQLVDHDRLLAHWHAVFPGQILEVPYEDLVEDTEGWARRLIAHLGLAWEPGVLEFQDLERPVKTASVWQVRQPVYKTSKARWRRHEASLGKLEAALGEVPPAPAPLPVPHHRPGLFLAGMDALKAGDARVAETRFRALLENYPRHAAACHFLGAALAHQGRIEEARGEMRRSLRLLPRHASWMENLAVLEERNGSTEVAKALRVRADRLRRGMSSEADATAAP
jgi:tetratricopeptide (TPR) repeat protein